MKNTRITKKARLILYLKNSVILILLALTIFYFYPGFLSIPYTIVISCYIAFTIWSYWVIYCRKTTDKFEYFYSISKESEVKEDDKFIYEEPNIEYAKKVKDPKETKEKIVKEVKVESRNTQDINENFSLSNGEVRNFLYWCNGKKLFSTKADYYDLFSNTIKFDPLIVHKYFIKNGYLKLREPYNELRSLTLLKLRNILRDYKKKITHDNKEETIKYILKNIPINNIYIYYELEKKYILTEKGKRSC